MMTELEQIMWIKQVKAFGLGNTITMTPGLREMSARLGKRIPIYFETEGLSALFADCRFIDVMAGPIRHCGPKYTSCKPERLKGESDYAAWARILNGAFTYEYLPPVSVTEPYVDACEPPQWWEHPKGKTIAIVHGCLGGDPATIQKKDVGNEIRQRMVDAVCEQGATPVVIGNIPDLASFWRHTDIFRKDVEFGALGNEDISLRRAVGIMQKCDGFITNATGMAHVGAASGMNGLVLWKHCNFEKNAMPSKWVKHAMQGQHGPAINRFVKKVVS